MSKFDTDTAVVEITMRTGAGVLIAYTASTEQAGGDVELIDVGDTESFRLGPHDSIAISRGHTEGTSSDGC